MKISITILLAGLCINFLQAQSTLSEKDVKFAKAAAESNMMEIKLGELAITNGSSQEVKDHGSQMVTDHKKAQNELNALAVEKNIPLPTQMNEKAQKHYDAMAKKQGKDFDKAYSKCMVMGHKKDICKFKKQAKKGDDQGLKTWASSTLPTLEQHKLLSEQTCKAVKQS